MEGTCLYRNREDAGKQLGKSLEKYRHLDPIILGIPRGGMEVAFHVAKHLDAQLSVIISQKLPHLLHPEYGIGAVCEGNITYIPKHIKINSSIINFISDKVRAEIAQKKLIYHKEDPIPALKNRLVIIVDDGIATGVTMVPAIRYCHKMHAAKIIVAAPVSGLDLNPDLEDANEIHVLHQPKDFETVGSYYKDFTQLTDKHVLFYLKAGHVFH